MEADAFRKLHPLEFLKRFLSQNLRPDGRPLQKERKLVTSLGASLG